MEERGGQNSATHTVSLSKKNYYSSPNERGKSSCDKQARQILVGGEKTTYRRSKFDDCRKKENTLTNRTLQKNEAQPPLGKSTDEGIADWRGVKS